jgi:hypothetical protein
MEAGIPEEELEAIATKILFFFTKLPPDKKSIRCQRRR